MKKKNILLAITLLSLAISLIGCSGGSASTEPTAATPAADNTGKTAAPDAKAETTNAN